MGFFFILKKSAVWAKYPAQFIYTASRIKIRNAQKKKKKRRKVL